MKSTLLFLFFILFQAVLLQAQNSIVKIGIIGQKFSEFSLPTYQGEAFSMDQLKGKNVLLIVSRGKYSENNWCTICQYQYAEWADLELTQNIRKKYNMEIAFLFPFKRDTFKRWEADFPSEMAKIESWKYPVKTDSLTEKQKNWIHFTRNQYPQTFNFTGKKVPMPLPLIADENFEVATGLDLYRNEWNKSKADQNIPAVYFIDSEGVLRFKYLSQSAVDRPTLKYLIEVIEQINSGKRNTN